MKQILWEKRSHYKIYYFVCYERTLLGDWKILFNQRLPDGTEAKVRKEGLGTSVQVLWDPSMCMDRQIDNGLFYLRQSPSLAPRVFVTRRPASKEHMCIQVFMSVSIAVTPETRVEATEMGLPGPGRLAGEWPCPALVTCWVSEDAPACQSAFCEIPLRTITVTDAPARGRPRLSLTEHEATEVFETRRAECRLRPNGPVTEWAPVVTLVKVIIYLE